MSRFNTLVSAAIRHDASGMIYTGHRHHNIIHCMVATGFRKPVGGRGKYTQGFIDDTGRFYNRSAGAAYVLRSGQITKLDNPPLLYSEDLY